LTELLNAVTEQEVVAAIAKAMIILVNSSLKVIE
jgi:hypothetical protein